jgi:hypothetical protein
MIQMFLSDEADLFRMTDNVGNATTVSNHGTNTDDDDDDDRRGGRGGRGDSRDHHNDLSVAAIVGLSVAAIVIVIVLIVLVVLLYRKNQQRTNTTRKNTIMSLSTGEPRPMPALENVQVVRRPMITGTPQPAVASPETFGSAPLVQPLPSSTRSIDPDHSRSLSSPSAGRTPASASVVTTPPASNPLRGGYIVGRPRASSLRNLTGYDDTLPPPAYDLSRQTMVKGDLKERLGDVEKGYSAS